jgi:hypothetical protein
MSKQAELLFVKHDAIAAQSNQPRALADAIESYNPDAILTANLDELTDYFVDRYRIDVPRLGSDDEITVSQEDERFDARRDPSRVVFDSSRPAYIPGTRFTWYVPYEGETELFYMRASTFTVNPPRAVVTPTELQFAYTTADMSDAPRLKAEFERELAKVRDHLAWLERDFKPFTDSLRDQTRALIEKRRAKLAADRGVVATLGYKVRERADAAKTYAVSTQRRPARAPAPPAARGAALEPTLDEMTYERILEICSSMATVLEQSPATFATLDEPDIRNHFLVQLNGHFQGDATGETFSAAGKTDILVKVDGKNIFIAECKFWSGSKSASDALDQLLSYATWRESKLALFIFSKGAGFTEVLRKIDQTMSAHAATTRRGDPYGASGFRYVLARPDDSERELTLTVLAFAIPAVTARRGK